MYNSTEEGAAIRNINRTKEFSRSIPPIRKMLLKTKTAAGQRGYKISPPQRANQRYRTEEKQDTKEIHCLEKIPNCIDFFKRMS